MFLLLSCKRSSYIPDSSPLSDMICKHFSHSVGRPVTFMMVSFDATKFLTLLKHSLSYFVVVALVFGVISKNLLPNVRLYRFILFTSKNL